MGSWGNALLSYTLRNASHYFRGLIFLTTFSVSMASAQTKVLNFDEGRSEQDVMPDGCQNPFRESIKFLEFFETSIVTIAAERGSKARGVDNLFAVNHIRERVNEISNKTGGEESAVDRLIVTQLCHFEKIATQKNAVSGTKALQILVTSPDLHDHLVAISSKLLKDSVAIFKIQASAIRDAKKQESFVNSRQTEVRRAKSFGEEKARDLID